MFFSKYTKMGKMGQLDSRQRTNYPIIQSTNTR